MPEEDWPTATAPPLGAVLAWNSTCSGGSVQGYIDAGLAVDGLRTCSACLRLRVAEGAVAGKAGRQAEESAGRFEWCQAAAVRCRARNEELGSGQAGRQAFKQAGRQTPTRVKPAFEVR
jgi:hypothetical protein